jgi:serine/threonine-protein kinase
LRAWNLPAGWTGLRRAPSRPGVRWALAALGALMAGYLTALLLVFPAPLLPGREDVPRVLGLPLAEARERLAASGLRAARDSAEPHSVAAAGVVVWQDPPPGVRAPDGTRVTLVASAGPAKIPVPDVAGYEVGLARTLVRASGLAVGRVETVPGAAPRGITVVTRPPAGNVVAPGTAVVLVVSEGAATIAVPQLLGMTPEDARRRLEQDGLQLGTVERRRTYDATPGTVVIQRPASGTLAAPGAVVDIIIARSP